MKKALKNFFVIFFLFSLIVSACQTQTQEALPTLVASQTSISPTSQPEIPTTAPSVAPVYIEPTTPPTSTPIPEAQLRIREIMVAYGHVDEKYLSAEYWDKMSARISEFGPAKRILTLEYHGDSYDMYDGHYAMTPESFVSQMEYLMQNNYHFVTGPETLGFLEGWLTLPARSVILTTDSGGGTLNSMPRIIALFRDLEIKYGYTPHMQSYIWTQSMDEATALQCKGDVCWPAFREYLETGYFTFGSHTQSHGDFGTFTRGGTEWDLTTNITKIRDGMGINVYSLTWPLEVCSPYEDIVRKVGIKFAFGGNTRAPDNLFTYQSDPTPLCLPRVFPPNPDGFSGRPSGLSFQEMLDISVLNYAPIH